MRWASHALDKAGQILISNGRHGCCGTQPGFHHVVTNNSGLLFDELSSGEDSEVRDAAYSEPCCELLVLVSVDLEDDGLTRHVPCGTRDFWGGGSTRAAPVSPEVDQDGNTRALDNLVEEGSVDRYRFVKRGQRSLAGATTSGVRQVVRRDAVLLAAALADSYRRHLLLQSSRFILRA
jgi:hypothetical protein